MSSLEKCLFISFAYLFANIILHSVGCLSVLLIVSFHVQVFSQMQSHLFSFVLFPLPKYIYPINIANSVRIYSLYFHQNSMVLSLTFKYLLVSCFFYILCEKLVQSHYFTCSGPVFPKLFIKEVFFPHCICLPI